MPADPPPEDLADRLKRAREQRARGSSELSIAVGASHGFVSEIERRKSKSLQAELAFKLARALDVPPEWLVMGEGPDPFAPAPKKKARGAK